MFEHEVETGTYLDGNTITFAKFTEIWLADYAEKQLSYGTLKPYKTRLEKRIIPALGHIKLAKIQPHHLLEFYNNLGEEGIRLDGMVKPTAKLLSIIPAYKKGELIEKTGISFKTIDRIYKGEQVKYETANQICATLGVELNGHFISDDTTKLSTKTIKHHHSLISTILATAVKWNLIPYNPAARVDTIKVEKYKPNYYDENEIQTMLALLGDEPIRYKTAVYLAIDTGIRKGEFAGLM